MIHHQSPSESEAMICYDPAPKVTTRFFDNGATVGVDDDPPEPVSNLWTFALLLAGVAVLGGVVWVVIRLLT